MDKTVHARKWFPDWKGGPNRAGYSDKKWSVYLVAVIDNQDRRHEEEQEKEEGLTKEDFKTMTKRAFWPCPKTTWRIFLGIMIFPKKYTSKEIMEMVSKDEDNTRFSG
ncbi:MAG: hypothetical protein R2788_19685 [Saprospiraceae bacterium]